MLSENDPIKAKGVLEPTFYYFFQKVFSYRESLPMHLARRLFYVEVGDFKDQKTFEANFVENLRENSFPAIHGIFKEDKSLLFPDQVTAKWTDSIECKYVRVVTLGVHESVYVREDFVAWWRQEHSEEQPPWLTGLIPLATDVSGSIALSDGELREKAVREMVTKSLKMIGSIPHLRHLIMSPTETKLSDDDDENRLKRLFVAWLRSRQVEPSDELLDLLLKILGEKQTIFKTIFIAILEKLDSFTGIKFPFIRLESSLVEVDTSNHLLLAYSDAKLQETEEMKLFDTLDIDDTGVTKLYVFYPKRVYDRKYPDLDLHQWWPRGSIDNVEPVASERKTLPPGIPPVPPTEPEQIIVPTNDAESKNDPKSPQASPPSPQPKPSETDVKQEPLSFIEPTETSRKIQSPQKPLNVEEQTNLPLTGTKAKTELQPTNPCPDGSSQTTTQQKSTNQSSSSPDNKKDHPENDQKKNPNNQNPKDNQNKEYAVKPTTSAIKNQPQQNQETA